MRSQEKQSKLVYPQNKKALPGQNLGPSPGELAENPVGRQTSRALQKMDPSVWQHLLSPVPQCLAPHRSPPLPFRFLPVDLRRRAEGGLC